MRSAGRRAVHREGSSAQSDAAAEAHGRRCASGSAPQWPSSCGRSAASPGQQPQHRTARPPSPPSERRGRTLPPPAMRPDAECPRQQLAAGDATHSPEIDVREDARKGPWRAAQRLGTLTHSARMGTALRGRTSARRAKLDTPREAVEEPALKRTDRRTDRHPAGVETDTVCGRGPTGRALGLRAARRLAGG